MSKFATVSKSSDKRTEASSYVNFSSTR